MKRYTEYIGRQASPIARMWTDAHMNGQSSSQAKLDVGAAATAATGVRLCAAVCACVECEQLCGFGVMANQVNRPNSWNMILIVCACALSTQSVPLTSTNSALWYDLHNFVCDCLRAMVFVCHRLIAKRFYLMPIKWKPLRISHLPAPYLHCYEHVISNDLQLSSHSCAFLCYVRPQPIRISCSSWITKHASHKIINERDSCWLRTALRSYWNVLFSIHFCFGIVVDMCVRARARLCLCVTSTFTAAVAY